MKRLLALVLFLSVYTANGQEDFNTGKAISIDASYMPFGSYQFLSTELEYKVKKHFFLVGLNYDINPGNDHRGYKLGFGFYPYRNLKKWKVFHQFTLYSDFEKGGPAVTNYALLGTGVEYWFNNRMAVGLSVNGGYGHRTGSTFEKDNGAYFYTSGLLTFKYVLKK
jgi:hypothetical protein